MAITNLREIELKLREGAKVAPETVRKVQQGAALNLQKTIAFGTPADKGRARGNWQMSQGAPATDELYPDGFAGESKDARGRAGFAAAIAQGVAVAAEIEPFTKTYISNRLPYIESLNEGTSVQAPAGFVETAVQVVRRNALQALDG